MRRIREDIERKNSLEKNIKKVKKLKKKGTRTRKEKEWKGIISTFY